MKWLLSVRADGLSDGRALHAPGGRFPLAQKPGLGFELTEASRAKYPFAGTRPMARVFHEDGSVAEWKFTDTPQTDAAELLALE